MGRRPAATSTAFSRQIVRAIEQLRDQARLSNAELIGAADFSANYFYMRLRGEAPFNTNDIEKLATALGVLPFEILQLASVSTDESESGRTERLDGRELARRLRFLTDTQAGNQDSFDVRALISTLHSEGVELVPEMWDSLLEETDHVRISSRLLSALAEYFKVDPHYLMVTRADEVAQRVEAEIEFQRALKTTGATAVTARALGDVSPNALRAITKSILSIEKET